MKQIIEPRPGDFCFPHPICQLFDWHIQYAMFLDLDVVNHVAKNSSKLVLKFQDLGPKSFSVLFQTFIEIMN